MATTILMPDGSEMTFESCMVYAWTKGRSDAECFESPELVVTAEEAA